MQPISYVEIAKAYVAEQYPIIVYGKPRLMDLPPGAIVGTWAISIMGKMRFIVRKEIELEPMTGTLPGDLARAWVRDQYKLPIRRRKDQLERSFQMPLHTRRGVYEDCAYIDLEKSYCQVLRLGWDLEYKPFAYLGANPVPVPPEIRANKLAYSLAVSMSINPFSDIEYVGKGGKTYTRSSMNMYSNPCLYNLTADTFCGIASEMIAIFGNDCVYCNTDGFIVKTPRMQEAIDLCDSWGFKASLKYKKGEPLIGKTKVLGTAAYDIGGYKSLRRDKNAYDFTTRLMDEKQYQWLKRRWQIWSKIAS